MGIVGDAAMDIVCDAATMCNKGFALILKLYLDESASPPSPKRSSHKKECLVGQIQKWLKFKMIVECDTEKGELCNKNISWTRKEDNSESMCVMQAEY